MNILRDVPIEDYYSLNLSTYEKSLEQKINNHGNVVGQSGETGVHCAEFIHRGSSGLPRPAGGVIVIVTSGLIPTADCLGADELRFTTAKEAVDYLDSLKVISLKTHLENIETRF